METEYRFILDTSSRKFICPNCRKKRFVKFIDTKNRNYLPEQYGRCDREENCNYHLDPYNDGYAKMIRDQEQGFKFDRSRQKPNPTIKSPHKKDPVFMPKDILVDTLKGYDVNVFIQNLCSRDPYPFEDGDVEKVISLYRLGTVTSRYMAGATTFPYIDTKGNVRGIQVRLYDQFNRGVKDSSIVSMKRHDTKKPWPEWLKAYDKQGQYSCLFGEHLLSKYPDNPIALVEAPKTAIYGTLYFGFPEIRDSLIWLAIYNKSSFSFEKMKVLQGRSVVVFPDLSKDGSTYNEWRDKAKDYERRLPGTRFVFSDLLERKAPEAAKKGGCDIADFLKNDWREYRNPIQNEQQEPPPTELFLSDNPQDYTGDEGTYPVNTVDFNRHSAKKFTPPEMATQKTVAALQDQKTATLTNVSGEKITAFTTHSNLLFIQNPADAHRFTVYPDIESYNKRTAYPDSIKKGDIAQDGFTPVYIDPVELKVLPDPYIPGE